MNKELEIAHKALDNLNKNVGISGNFELTDINAFDGYVVFQINGREIKYNAEIKQELRTHQLYKIFDQANLYNPLIIIANRIFPKIKEELRKNNIAYLETNGNIFIKYNNIFLWVDAQKPLEQEKDKTNRTFSKTGLKVLFNFFTHDALINGSYRDIAAIAKVGLGNINYVINGLKEANFLISLNSNEYKLQNKEKLLNKWLAAYEEKLKPSLLIGSFRFANQADFFDWKNIVFDNPETVWGGEPAADILTNYLRPEILTIYTNETRNELIRKYRLIPDDNGNVKIYNRFWNDSNHIVNDRRITPVLLIYADLMTTHNSRCIETASRIYQDQIKNELITN